MGRVAKSGSNLQPVGAANEWREETEITLSTLVVLCVSLVCHHDFRGAENVVSFRKPLSIALSQDGGETWPWIRDIETGASASQHDEAEEDGGKPDEYSYPSVLQDADGKINVAYTYRREAIKVVRFDEEWVQSGTTVGNFKGDRPR